MGIGIDIEHISRFEKIVLEEKKTFLDKIFTDKELDYCYSKINPYPHLTARFAGKEAVIKAVNSKMGKMLDYNVIEIINNENGVPQVMIKINGFEDICIEISLSHSNDFAIAFAIIK